MRYVYVGQVIAFPARHALGGLRPSRPVPAAMYFDLALPGTYLAAERAERLFAGLAWLPARSAELTASAPEGPGERARLARRARFLGLPLVWPDERPAAARAAMRVAALAAERNCAAGFVLAASRLAFCGGFEIDAPEILAEAAAAAGLAIDEALAAAADATRDAGIERAGRRLERCGARALPALRLGDLLFCGEERLPEAAAALAAMRRGGASGAPAV